MTGMYVCVCRYRRVVAKEMKSNIRLAVKKSEGKKRDREIEKEIGRKWRLEGDRV